MVRRIPAGHVLELGQRATGQHSPNRDIIPPVSTLSRPNQAQRRVNVDFPEWMIASLDREAARLGVTRQSLIKVWLAEHLESTWRAR